MTARNDASAAAVTLIGPDEPGWDAALVTAGRSVFHGAGYHRYSRGLGSGEPYLALVGDERRGLAWPYILRSIAEIPGVDQSGLTDIHSVYGYPGPIAWGCPAGDPYIDRAVASIRDLWRTQRVVSVFTRFNPLLQNASLLRHLPAGRAGLGAPGVIVAGPTVSVDLTLTHEVVRTQYGRGLAREIALARGNGLTTVHDTAWAHLSTFVDLYQQTMTRLGASDFYNFTQDDFLRLRATVGAPVHLLVTLLDGVVAAAGVFLEQDGAVEWHLVGSSHRFRGLSPEKVMVDDAIQWARRRGNQVLHLGGGRGAREDSLFWFKSRFSPRRHQFCTGRWILEPGPYEALSAARRSALPPERVIDPDYFPAYRAPLLPARES
jgi:hypothetical protein